MPHGYAVDERRIDLMQYVSMCVCMYVGGWVGTYAGCSIQEALDTGSIDPDPLYTVESLYRVHHWDPAGCPVWRGVPNTEVDLYTALCVVGTADSVLIREVSFIQSILNREVPLLVHIRMYVCAVEEAL